MILYQGSNVAVHKPRIILSDRALDFGSGFYLTTDYDQALKWAKLITKRRNVGVPTVSVYELSDEVIKNMKILRFDSADEMWLRFICDNRKKQEIENTYDMIIGPVANDNTMPTINLYLEGIYTEKEALKRLLPQKLKDQVVIKTDKAIKELINIEVKRV